jgi:K+-sensing histidine kinase KdpD
MNDNRTNRRTLEIILVLTTIVLTCMLYQTVGYKIVVLNLFYLPVILAAFYLGRYRASVLAFFSVLTASIVCALSLGDFAAFTSPLVIGLSIVVWGAVLGLTALLVGTLSDDLSSRMTELHEAYVGVVEVLTRYLQSANPRLKDRSQRIAELCQEAAVQLRLSVKEVDDIRVAALLHDMENIEITARVIRKAVGDIEDEQKGAAQHTFHGTELVHSLGPVLQGAFPLVLNQEELEHAASGLGTANVPIGARIIRTVRAYDALMYGKYRLPGTSPADAIKELKRDAEARHDPEVLHALERVICSAPGREKATAPKSGREPKPIGAV